VFFQDVERQAFVNAWIVICKESPFKKLFSNMWSCVLHSNGLFQAPETDIGRPVGAVQTVSDVVCAPPEFVGFGTSGQSFKEDGLLNFRALLQPQANLGQGFLATA